MASDWLAMPAASQPPRATPVSNRARASSSSRRDYRTTLPNSSGLLSTTRSDLGCRACSDELTMFRAGISRAPKRQCLNKRFNSSIPPPQAGASEAVSEGIYHLPSLWLGRMETDVSRFRVSNLEEHACLWRPLICRVQIRPSIWIKQRRQGLLHVCDRLLATEGGALGSAKYQPF